MTERRTQAERRATSRARLVEAAIQLLGSRGYARTSLAEIGKEAGLSRGLVSHYFGSKEACMHAVVITVREATAARLTAVDMHGLGAIDRLLDVYFAGLRDHDAYAQAMYVILVEGVTATPGLRPAVAETNAISRDLITNLVREAVAAGDSGHQVDPDSVAVLLEGILRGVALQWLADPDGIDLERVISVAKSMVRAVLASQPTALN